VVDISGKIFSQVNQKLTAFGASHPKLPTGALSTSADNPSFAGPTKSELSFSPSVPLRNTNITVKVMVCNFVVVRLLLSQLTHHLSRRGKVSPYG